MDPLSDVLSLLKPRSQFYAGLDAAGAWSFDFPPHQGIKFTAVLKGTCWGRTAGQEQPMRFAEGDCYLLNSGQRLILSSSPDLAPEDPSDIMEAIAHDGIALHNGGGEVFLISVHFDFSNSQAAVLFDALPSLIHVEGGSSQAQVLRWALDQLATELRHQEPGSTLVSTHLAHLMLVQILRLHLANTSPGSPSGWFLALSDHQVASAIGAIHSAPQRRWTLEELARVAGMSRTVFAQRFKQLVGRTAMEYLVRWRMLMAADRLRSGSENIASIAFSLGYESESAFSTAFKRTMSRSPSQYRRGFVVEGVER
ncbi:AraC-type DNA-binding protein [Pseudomonas citronellolis]|uniref:AraC-type DNA-binding protein n=1 Tax=Pseudomonas citronellolis TaxID=53408 RepID=A0AAQ1KNX7_9PSED|nr:MULTISPECIES: AraC family transcriptional regulator [Pseudomonas]MCL6692479.1 AraC family transcriptional regulator [Pseudomonas sp. R3.Fl]MCP1607819.1 AraC-like DNA-binding protein [Pseudomonas citronellolis]MCP1658820.1 AraC-like DNA-binding protein [Pseudomonas citronellolis]MCP1725769.1 AraC-like DNA-binding protein [Pseudomonas citronellolis]MDN6876497.1 AraC family transcriptional regulator [Pseudomonas citronellolis]